METLPDEILHEIFLVVAELPATGPWNPNWRRQSHNLHRLTLVSRRFNSIANPMMYRRIRVPLSILSPDHAKLCQTIQGTPSLAHYIRAIEVLEDVESCNRQPHDILPELLELQGLPGLSFLRERKWNPWLLDLEKRSDAGDNVIIALWILQAQNMEEFHVEMRRVQYFSDGSIDARLPLVVEKLGKAIYDSLEKKTTRFERLRTLRLDLDGWHFFPEKGIIPFLHLPNLKKVRLKGWGWAGGVQKKSVYGDDGEWPLRTCSVEEIRLCISITIPHMAVKLLQACAKVTKFDLSPTLFNADNDHRDWYNTISEGLELHSETLESLTIWNDTIEWWKELGTLDYTTGLTHLRSIDVPGSLILQDMHPSKLSEMLPPTIEFATLRFQTVRQHTTRFWTILDQEIAHFANSMLRGVSSGRNTHLKAIELIVICEDEPPPRPGYLNIEFPIYRFDIKSSRSKLQERGVAFDVSVEHKKTDHYYPPPTVEDMRELQFAFTGFVSWCKGHRKLRASTCKEPVIKREEDDDQANPYATLWKPWDWESGEINSGWWGGVDE